MFEFLYDCVKKKGLVYDAYLEKIIEREAEFPTGIQLSNIGIAIPHTDAEYAKGDAFVVMTSEEGIPFKNMEDGVDLKANVIIGLVFYDKDKHVEYLQSLVELFQNEEALIKIKNSKDIDEIYNLLMSKKES